jgi:hypothetical protein
LYKYGKSVTESTPLINTKPAIKPWFPENAGVLGCPFSKVAIAIQPMVIIISAIKNALLLMYLTNIKNITPKAINTIIVISGMERKLNATAGI